MCVEPPVSLIACYMPAGVELELLALVTWRLGLQLDASSHACLAESGCLNCSSLVVRPLPLQLATCQLEFQLKREGTDSLICT